MITLARKRTIYTCIGLLMGGMILLGPTACEEHSGSSPSISAAADDSNSSAASIDSRLIGRWRHTDTYVSGQFTAATDRWFVLNADGTYEYFKGKSAAGNAATTMVNSAAGDVAKGKWRAESKILYTCADGSDQWQAAGRYLIDEGRFMVNKVVWERQ
jgi:hypothetical protein